MLEEIKKEFYEIFPQNRFIGYTSNIIWPFIKQKLTEAAKQAKIEENEYWEKKIFHPDSTMPGLSIMDFAVRVDELKGDK